MSQDLLLSNKTLEDFLEKVDLPEDKKTLIRSQIPEMDWDTRVKLLKMMTRIYFIDLEQKEIVEQMGTLRKFIKDPTEENYKRAQIIAKE